jgi:hypothetical protein
MTNPDEYLELFDDLNDIGLSRLAVKAFDGGFPTKESLSMALQEVIEKGCLQAHPVLFRCLSGAYHKGTESAPIPANKTVKPAKSDKDW